MALSEGTPRGKTRSTAKGTDIVARGQASIVNAAKSSAKEENIGGLLVSEGASETPPLLKKRLKRASLWDDA